ncbi:hypothetical protein ZWY2020_033424 [Hordeum vulgare]|nr:hypothetical protein ZWY2020_033424 [Hordeum vulgare]
MDFCEAFPQRGVAGTGFLSHAINLYLRSIITVELRKHGMGFEEKLLQILGKCSKVLCTCILIIVVSSSQAEARRLTTARVAAVASKGKEPWGALESNSRSFRATSTETSVAGAAGLDGEAMSTATTVESRGTAPGNSPGIGNKGKINN